jgi:hypothetical protein
MSDQSYYDDFTRHGEYQYVLVEQIINDIMANMDEDSYLFNIPRHTILYHAKRGVRELYYDVMQEIKAIELTVSQTLSITMPPDYVNYVRISCVDDNGILHPLAQDDRQSIARSYLQDNKYRLLYDNNGCVLQGSGVRETINGDQDQDDELPLTEYYFENYYSSFRPNLDRSRIFNNGKFAINKIDGTIEFGSDIYTRNIVLEYISDGLYVDECEGSEDGIKVHKFAEEALINYIYYKVINAKRHAPAVEKQWTKKEFFRTKKVAKSRIKSVRLENVMQAAKSDSVWIKGLYG